MDEKKGMLLKLSKRYFGKVFVTAGIALSALGFNAHAEANVNYVQTNNQQEYVEGSLASILAKSLEAQNKHENADSQIKQEAQKQENEDIQWIVKGNDYTQLENKVKKIEEMQTEDTDHMQKENFDNTIEKNEEMQEVQKQEEIQQVIDKQEVKEELTIENNEEEQTAVLNQQQKDDNEKEITRFNKKENTVYNSKFNEHMKLYEQYRKLDDINDKLRKEYNLNKIQHYNIETPDDAKLRMQIELNDMQMKSLYNQIMDIEQSDVEQEKTDLETEPKNRDIEIEKIDDNTVDKVQQIEQNNPVTEKNEENNPAIETNEENIEQENQNSIEQDEKQKSENMQLITVPEKQGFFSRIKNSLKNMFKGFGFSKKSDIPKIEDSLPKPKQIVENDIINPIEHKKKMFEEDLKNKTQEGNDIATNKEVVAWLRENANNTTVQMPDRISAGLNKMRQEARERQLKKLQENKINETEKDEER